tara:strand:- start:145 stop:561 length:417 start_codon:yes stop_codon:yes gene_type:complete
MEFFPPIIVWIVRIILGILFVFSGAIKIPKLSNFYHIVVQYGILKGKLVKLFAYSLPFVELLIGILILVGILFPWSILLTLFMLLISTFGIGYALYQKKKMEDCGCYAGIIKVPIGWKKIVENAIWILLAIYLFVAII